MSDFIVCPECRGHGTTDNRNFNGFTSADMEDFDDFHSEYASGMYSVPCDLCKGRRVTTESEIEEWKDEQQYESEYRAESWAYVNGY